MADRMPPLLLLAFCTLLAGGCKALEISPPKNWFAGDEDKPVVPTSVAAVWSNAVLQRADGALVRGFGGRLMFYGPDGQKPVRVDGSLAVYGFDETNRDPRNTRPDRKYLFTREQLASHYSKSELGHSYSIWIPWESADGPTRPVSLIVRFNPVEGAAVVGELAKLTLRGNDLPAPSQPRPAQPPPSRTPSEVQPAGHQSRDAADALQPLADHGAPARMATTTIPIPPRGGR
jgi:hypothetical protein